MIRILITEDSAVVAMLLKTIFEQEDDLEVVGHARDGREAVAMTAALHPDLITMDIRMPVMDGFEATREIMSERPTPIVVISSSVDDEELRITFRAIEEGALAVIEKPQGFGHPDFESIRRNLVNTVRAMAEVKLVRRRRHPPPETPRARPAAPPREKGECELVAIGASTGGPQALRHLLAALPREFAAPVVVVQHIGSGFLSGLVGWLNGFSGPRVRLAEHGTALRGGEIYFAPDGRHLKVERVNRRLIATLHGGPTIHGVRPSVEPLFESVAHACGMRAVGVLLSGMGEDGAKGLLALRRAGARTLAQSAESCVVFGMPGAAVALGAVQETLGLEAIAARLRGCAEMGHVQSA
jgi:two-component system chemotaxis response regulator CheB